MKMYSFRMKLEEIEELKRKAKDKGLTVSEYVRESLLGKKVIVRVKDEKKKTT